MSRATSTSGDVRHPSVLRSRWAALGAAVAVTIGVGGVGLVEATVTQGERPILVQMEPCRLLDTRAGSGIGPRDTPIGTAESYDVAAHGVNGNCEIPTEASGLSLNVTAIGATAITNVRIFPSDATLPLTSNLNPSPGAAPAPNSVTTGLDDGGMFTLYNEFGSVDLIVDVNGFYEDHNHDDRYVEQNDVLWAVVRPNGEIGRSSDGVIGSFLVEEGSYGVLFQRDITNCAYQATVGRRNVDTSPPIGFAQVANWDENPLFGVAVFTKDSNGAATGTRGFHLTVNC